MFAKLKKFFVKKNIEIQNIKIQDDEVADDLRRKVLFGAAAATGFLATEIAQASTWKKVSTTVGSSDGEVDVDQLTANTTVNGTSRGKLLACNGTFTITLTAAATVDNGWWCYVANLGTGVVTITSPAADMKQIGGTTSSVASITIPDTGSGANLYNNGTVMIVCTGTGYNIIPVATPHGSVTYTASGVWVCPVGVTTAWITGIGGGGSGGSRSGGTINPAGGGGGSGDMVMRQRVSVVPGTPYTVTVGAAGAASSFGALVSLAAGAAGGSAGGNGGGSRGSDGSPGGGNGAAPGGYGGYGMFGGGARGGANGAAGTAAPANTGGGGGGAGNSNVTLAGGAGGSGIIIVEW